MHGVRAEPVVRGEQVSLGIAVPSARAQAFSHWLESERMNEKEAAMILYHGSNVAVSQPVVGSSRRNLDFGPAFYCTSDRDQAVRWALRTAKLRGVGVPVVSSFAFDEEAAGRLRVLRFFVPDGEWLRYVARNRTGPVSAGDVDIVVGPVADDQTIRTVNDFIAGRFSEEIAIQLLLPQKLKDQYAFKTDDALRVLRFEEVAEA